MTAITAKVIRRRLLTRLALAAVVWLGGLHGAHAGEDVWTATGPEGGTIRALAIDPQNPATLYAAVTGNTDRAGADVYKSTDAGGSWRAVAIGLPLSGSRRTVASLAVDPHVPTTVYLGGSGGVYKSTDGGGRWTPVKTGLPVGVYSLVVDLQTPGTLYAGTFGDGVFKSTDGGGSWNAVNTGLPKPNYPGSYYGPYPSVEALAIDPRTPTTIYLGLNGNGHVDHGGVYKSTDGGGSWSPASTGLGEGPISSLAIDPQTPDHALRGHRL